MTSMRRRYVASTSLQRHVPAGNSAPPSAPQYSKAWPPNILNLPTPMVTIKYSCRYSIGAFKNSNGAYHRSSDKYCINSLTTKKAEDKFSSANFQKKLSPSYIILRIQRLDEVAHHEPSHQDLHCLQIQLFSSLILKELTSKTTVTEKMYFKLTNLYRGV